MVIVKNTINLLALCILVWCFLEGYEVNLPPRISISIPEEAAVEGRQIPLYITVDHMEKDTVDSKSFQIKDSPLSVEPLQEEKIAPEEMYKGSGDETLVVNKYRAILPKKEPGIYDIGPVSAVVGGERYSSSTMMLHVLAAVVSRDFRLEMSVEAPPKIFLGQEVVFEYRIFFNGSMQLLREELPLLNVPGFLTVGSPEIRTESAAKGFVQIIAQRAKAVTPGTYEIGVSTIEGMAVEGAQKALVPPLYRAQAPSKAVTILPFPNEKRPSFFDGALGSFVWRVSSLDDNTVTIGEPVHIEYRVSGRGVLSTVHFPSLDRLTGLTDSFWTDSTPPVGEEISGTKRFVLVLRPKRLGPVDVPGFFTASFDPFSEQYLTVAVAPVKLTVEGSREAETQLAKSAPVVDRLLEPPFEIDASSASVQYLSPTWIVAAFCCAIALGILQIFVKRSIVRGKERKETSRDLFYRAVMNRGNREKGLKLLQQALYLQLFEVGLTPTLVDTPEDIEGEGLASEAKTLLQLLDRQLYKAGETRVDLKEIYDEASSLHYRIKQIRVVSLEQKGGET